MIIDIIEWNVNFKSDKKVNIAEFIKDYINDNDIIIFTEIVKNDNVIKLLNDLKGYNFYESAYDEKNQVIIVVKKDYQIANIVTHIPRKAYSGRVPDFLQIEVVIDNKKYCIIGTRIKIGGFDEFDYEERARQFKILSNYINETIAKEYENIIILGDFNNGMIFENTKDYNRIIKCGKRKGKCSLLKFYNYHIIKDELGDDFEFVISKGKSSWGLSYCKDSDSICYGAIKDDHIIVSKNIKNKVVDSSYDWDFVKDNEQKYKAMLNRDRIELGYPDHAILRATLDL